MAKTKPTAQKTAPHTGGESGNKKKGSQKSKDEKQLRAEIKEWREKFQKEQAAKKQLAAVIEALRVDKGELEMRLATKEKQTTKNANQLSLTLTMITVVRTLVQQQMFRYWPLLDKNMFHQINGMSMLGPRLGIKEEDKEKYLVEVRRMCIEKTNYWREYCAEKVRLAYIRKCLWECGPKKIVCDGTNNTIILDNVFIHRGPGRQKGAAGGSGDGLDGALDARKVSGGPVQGRGRTNSAGMEIDDAEVFATHLQRWLGNATG